MGIPRGIVAGATRGADRAPGRWTRSRRRLLLGAEVAADALDVLRRDLEELDAHLECAVERGGDMDDAARGADDLVAERDRESVAVADREVVRGLRAQAELVQVERDGETEALRFR